MIAIDFETFYIKKEYSVADLGAIAYVRDPRFKATLVSLYDGGELSWVGRPEDFNWQALHGHHLCAHNATFDSAVFTRLQELGTIPEEVAPLSWTCTADLAAYCFKVRSLAEAVAAGFKTKVSKELRAAMDGLTPEQAQERGMWEDFKTYAMQDAIWSWKLWDAYHQQWPEHEQQISQLNREMGMQGMRLDVPSLEEAKAKLNAARFLAEQDIPWSWGEKGEGKTPLSPKKLALECRKEGIPAPVSMAEDNEDCRQWEDTYGEKYPWVRACRDWRRTNIMLQKLERMQQRLQPGDLMPFELIYGGAHTMRFAGGGGVNLQNLPKEARYGVDIRNLIIPRPGHKFIIADLSQIEPRVLAWMVNDWEFLGWCRGGASPYESFARKVFGWAGGVLKKEDPRLYALAKMCVLGAGYGIGAPRFQEQAANPPYNLQLSVEEAYQAVELYRQHNPAVVQFWRTLHQLLDQSARKREDLVLELPSGRRMVYPRPCRILVKGKKGENGEPDTPDRFELAAQLGNRFVRLYGGKLTENVVQAIARDAFCDRYLALFDEELPVLFHVHDEYILEVPEEGIEQRLAHAKRIIETPPSWMPAEFPLNCEAFICDHYEK